MKITMTRFQTKSQGPEKTSPSHSDFPKESHRKAARYIFQQL